MRQFAWRRLAACGVLTVLAACAALPGIRLTGSLGSEFEAADRPLSGSIVFVMPQTNCADALDSTETYCDGVVFAQAQPNAAPGASLSNIRLYGARSYALELATTLNTGAPVLQMPREVRLLGLGQGPEASGELMALELTTPSETDPNASDHAVIFGKRACGAASCVVTLSQGFPGDLAALRGAGVQWDDSALKCATFFVERCSAENADGFAALVRAASEHNALTGPYEAGFLYYRPN